MSTDLINGLIEAGGAMLLCKSIWLAYKQKKVHGVSVLSVAFFMFWGYWNLAFYPSVNCWYSFTGGILMVIANTIWVGQLIYYSRKQKEDL